MVVQHRESQETGTLKEKQIREKTEVLYFDFQQGLPEGDLLAFYPSLGTLSYLRLDPLPKMPSLLAQQQFSPKEWRVLKPILNAAPTYCSHTAMYASYHIGIVNEESLAQAHQRLQQIKEYGIWDAEMRPVRNVLSRVRYKLKFFNLDAISILETGYILMLLPQEHTKP